MTKEIDEDTPINGSQQYDEHGNALEIQQDLDTGLWYSLNAAGIPTWRASVSAMAMVCGIGVLGLSKGLSQAGWLGVPLLIFLGFMANYTGKVLLKSLYLQKETVTTTYHGLAKVAFGPIGYYIVIVLQNCALFSASIIFLLLSGANMQLLSTAWGMKEYNIGWFIALTGLIIIAPIIGLKTLKEVSWIAIFGILATVLTIIVIIVMPPVLKHANTEYVNHYVPPNATLYNCHPSSGPSVNVTLPFNGTYGASNVTVNGTAYNCTPYLKPPGYAPLMDPHTDVINSANLPTAFATMVFAFGGHNVFPALACTMRDTRTYGGFLNGAFIAIVLLYLPPAIIPYAYFGDQVSNPILNPLFAAAEPLGKGYNIPIYFAYVAITLHLWFTIPIINNPVFLWVEEVTTLDKRQGRTLWRAIYRTLLIALQVLIAWKLPYFGELMDIIGATVISATVFFLPCLMYLKLNWSRTTYLEVGWNYIVLLLATLGSVVGFINAMLALINKVREDEKEKDVALSNTQFYACIGGATGLGAISFIIVFWYISVQSKRRTGYQVIS